MFSLKVLVLFCSLLVSINSSPIGELPETEQSLLPETSDEDKVVGDKIQLKESKLVVQEANATIPELESSYCSQFDNTCITCLKIDNCTMIRYTMPVKHDTEVEVTNYEFKCFDINTSMKEIGEAFENQRYVVVQSKSECLNQSPKQPNLEVNKEEKTESVVKAQTTEAGEGSDQTTVKSTSTTNTSTTTTKSTTTSGTTLTSSANITTSNTTTPQNTTEATKTTTSNPTSATNSTQLPITSKNPPPPASGGGWSFWSFFGGILLTLGLSAIGFVGFKYYKARAGQPGGGLNYNRF